MEGSLENGVQEKNLKTLLIIQSPRCFNLKKRKVKGRKGQKKKLLFSLHKRPVETEANSVFRKIGRV